MTRPESLGHEQNSMVAYNSHCDCGGFKFNQFAMRLFRLALKVA